MDANARLGELMAHLEARFESAEGRLLQLDATAKSLDTKIEAVARDLSERLDATSNRTLSFVVGSWLTVMLAPFFHR